MTTPRPGRWIARWVADHERDRLSLHLNALRVLLPTPCGPIIAPFRPADPGYAGVAGLQRFRDRLHDEEALVARHGEIATLRMFLGDLPLPPPLTITVDRRDVTRATTVRLGALTLDPHQGIPRPTRPRRPWTWPRGFSKTEAALYRVFAPRCAEGRALRIGGALVGHLPPMKTARGLIVIDVMGTHAYGLQRESPRTRKPALARTTPRTPGHATSRTSSAPDPNQASELLPRGHLHTLDEGPPADVIEMPFPPCPELPRPRHPCTTIVPLPHTSAPSRSAPKQRNSLPNGP